MLILYKLRYSYFGLELPVYHSITDAKEAARYTWLHLGGESGTAGRDLGAITI